jgi:hypothetical protein
MARTLGACQVDRDVILGEYLKYSRQFVGCDEGVFCTLSFSVRRSEASR